MSSVVFDRRLGKELIAFVARAEGRLVAAAYLLIIEKPANVYDIDDSHKEEFDYDISGGFSDIDCTGFPLSMMVQGKNSKESMK